MQLLDYTVKIIINIITYLVFSNTYMCVYSPYPNTHLIVMYKRFNLYKLKVNAGSVWLF